MNQKTVNQNSIAAFSVASLVFGILSLVTCCTGVGSLVAGGLGILFTVLSKRYGSPMPTLSVVGGILSGIGMALGLFLTIYTLVAVIIPILTDPQAYEEFNTLYQRFYGVSLEDALGGYRPAP